MRRIGVTIGIWLIAAAFAESQHEATERQGVTGDLRLHQLASRVFGNTRTLRVWLPPCYDSVASQGRRYPVLYLNDGQNLFDSATSLFNPMEWRADETARALIESGAIDPVIVVGIDNAGRRARGHEYLPWVDVTLSPPEPDPQGRRYPEFLVDEVIPFVNARYRTRTDAASTALGGSSYGALISLYVALVRPSVFGRLLLESPSLYVDDAHILREVAQGQWPARVYIGVGTNEGGRPGCDPRAARMTQMVSDVRRLEQLLRHSGLDSTRLLVTVAPCAVHDEAAWAARLPDALRFLFRR